MTNQGRPKLAREHMDRQLRKAELRITELGLAEREARRDVRDRCIEIVRKWRAIHEAGDLDVNTERLEFMLSTMKLKPR